MPLTDLNVGSAADDGTGQTLRSGGQLINQNFEKVLEGPAGGATDGAIVLYDGTSGRLTKDGQQPEQVSGETVVTGTTYTLNAGDAGALVRTTNASPVTITVPSNASVAYAPRTVISIVQYGDGAVTIQGASGVVINSALGATELAVKYSVATLFRVTADEWLLFGALV